jgi:signal transduction histidine kinase/phage shock protein PspC (stress-responsive transcriptional regulator)
MPGRARSPARHSSQDCAVSTSREKLRRDTSRAVFGGVAAGVARRFDIDPVVVRIGFVVIAIATSGFGALAYLIAWAGIPASPAGAAGRRERSRGRRGSWRIAIGVGLVTVSVLLVFRQLGVWWTDALAWPLALAAFGVALLWGLTRPAPEPGEAEEAEAAESALPFQAREPRERASRVSRAMVGVAFVIAAALLVLWKAGTLNAAGDAALAALVVTVSLVLISAPLWWSMARRLGAEKLARVRSQERAEVAAHLHDSVLQTLALMQKRAGDRDEVAKLARRQERELRSWLAGGEPAKPTERLADALRATAEDVEEAHGAPIDAIVVGDAPLDERMEALVAACREALTNAAKFAADAGPVHLYAEIENGSARVFIDDRGPGFDPDAIPGDRRGVRESIIGRMRRYGGRAEIRSGPGDGTEVELAVEGGGK